MSSTEIEFFNKIKELYELYEKVKLAIIYAENFDPAQELYLAPLNQLRSALDHIFKAVAHPDDLEYELKEAKEHLDRAGYDAFEVLASNLGIILIEKLNGYSTDNLATVFPYYYKTIKPDLIGIKIKLGEIRKRKKDSILGSDEPFSSYFDQIQKLLEYNELADKMIPSLEEFQQKKKKEKFKERVYNFLIAGVISSIISGLIVFYITNTTHKTTAKPYNNAEKYIKNNSPHNK